MPNDRMGKVLFITGTGTSVGKTYVSAQMIKMLKDFGNSVFYYKPVLSGAEEENGRLIPGDVRYVCEEADLRETSGEPVAAENYVTFFYRMAVSPHLASQTEGDEVTLDAIRNDFKAHLAHGDFLTVEGCGGLVCPLCWHEKNGEKRRVMQEDVILDLGLSVLIVTDSGLGCLNSVTLTVEYARIKGIHVVGIMMNRYEEGNPLHEDNRRMITELTSIPVVGRLREHSEKIILDIPDVRELYHIPWRKKK